MLKKLLLGLVSFSVLMLGAVAAIKNAQEVTFNYYIAEISAPFVLFLFIALALGAILGVMISSLWVFKQHRQIKRLEQSKALVQKELDNLRALRSDA